MVEGLARELLKHQLNAESAAAGLCEAIPVAEVSGLLKSLGIGSVSLDDGSNGSRPSLPSSEASAEGLPANEDPLSVTEPEVKEPNFPCIDEECEHVPLAHSLKRSQRSPHLPPAEDPQVPAATAPLPSAHSGVQQPTRAAEGPPLSPEYFVSWPDALPEQQPSRFPTLKGLALAPGLKEPQEEPQPSRFPGPREEPPEEQQPSRFPTLKGLASAPGLREEPPAEPPVPAAWAAKLPPKATAPAVALARMETVASSSPELAPARSSGCYPSSNTPSPVVSARREGPGPGPATPPTPVFAGGQDEVYGLIAPLESTRAAPLGPAASSRATFPSRQSQVYVAPPLASSARGLVPRLQLPASPGLTLRTPPVPVLVSSRPSTPTRGHGGVSPAPNGFSWLAPGVSGLRVPTYATQSPPAPPNPLTPAFTVAPSAQLVHSPMPLPPVQSRLAVPVLQSPRLGMAPSPMPPGSMPPQSPAGYITPGASLQLGMTVSGFGYSGAMTSTPREVPVSPLLQHPVGLYRYAAASPAAVHVPPQQMPLPSPRIVLADAVPQFAHPTMPAPGFVLLEDHMSRSARGPPSWVNL